MSRASKGLFVLVLLFSVLGTGLLYNGIGRLKRAGVPPFNEGLYTMIWSVPPPPLDLIRWCDRTLGRVIVWSSVMSFLILSLVLTWRGQWTMAAFLLIGLGGTISGFFGLWTWISSLFNTAGLAALPLEILPPIFAFWSY